MAKSPWWFRIPLLCDLIVVLVGIGYAFIAGAGVLGAALKLFIASAASAPPLVGSVWFGAYVAAILSLIVTADDILKKQWNGWRWFFKRVGHGFFVFIPFTAALWLSLIFFNCLTLIYSEHVNKVIAQNEVTELRKPHELRYQDGVFRDVSAWPRAFISYEACGHSPHLIFAPNWGGPATMLWLSAVNYGISSIGLKELNFEPQDSPGRELEKADRILIHWRPTRDRCAINALVNGIGSYGFVVEESDKIPGWMPSNSIWIQVGSDVKYAVRWAR